MRIIINFVKSRLISDIKLFELEIYYSPPIYDLISLSKRHDNTLTLYQIIYDFKGDRYGF